MDELQKLDTRFLESEKIGLSGFDRIGAAVDEHLCRNGGTDARADFGIQGAQKRRGESIDREAELTTFFKKKLAEPRVFVNGRLK